MNALLIIQTERGKFIQQKHLAVGFLFWQFHLPPKYQQSFFESLRDIRQRNIAPLVVGKSDLRAEAQI